MSGETRTRTRASNLQCPSSPSMKLPIRAVMLASLIGLLAACNSNPSQPSPSTPTPAGSPPPPVSGSSGGSGQAQAPAGSPSSGSPATGSQPASGQTGDAGATQGTTNTGGEPSSAGGAGAQAESAGATTPGGSGSAPTGGGTSSSGSGARTQAERAEDWDRAFEVSLGEFDKRLEGEQAALEKAGGNTGRSSDGSGADGDGRGSGGTSGNGVNTAGMPAELPVDENGEAGSTETTSTGGGGFGQSGPRFPAPEGVPVGHDDDVVARQLREAAEREPDPELRAKLWEEYRKYKSRKG